MILVSINVLELDKSRFKEVTLRSGKKAIYADIVLIDTPNGEYGDFMVKQGVTKEERAARKEMPILGNGKIVGGGGKRTQPTTAARSTPQSSDPPF